ncbi:hypothetical protein Vadar_022085 [Vaccinium darrowii]|uniref:Uncharacterized protein n=1 Tax=Vaccinium darrowii TaxID=229202 RepID=A0ACB7Y9H3_9ERIC|nr:hypothetical protein Vadar_022085 [Vaccinium darrowii]
MQNSDLKQPGFFITPSPKNPDYKFPINRNPVAEELEISNSLKKGILNQLVEHEKNTNENPSANSSFLEKPVVCTRCHCLRHYGKVKDPMVENLLPDFDFDHTVGRKLNSTTRARAVVLMVVAAVDFDGSFPKKVAKLVSTAIDENSTFWKEGKSGNVPRVVLVVARLIFCRVRCLQLGWSIGFGLEQEKVEPVITRKHVGGKIMHLTEAPVPGTTLGIVRVEGVLPSQAKLYDTPGLLHPHQISTRLTREEQRLVQISKELKPRTYRIKPMVVKTGVEKLRGKVDQIGGPVHNQGGVHTREVVSHEVAGHSVHIGGLMRLDIEELSADSIYITVWASPYLPLHMGKTVNVQKMLEDHFGRQLQPPIGEKLSEELGLWVRKEFRVSGNFWDASSVDIAVAGLGWFAIGLKGEASLGVWTYDGINVILRNSLIPDRAQNFEVAGFTVLKIVSKADQTSNKWKRQSGKKHKRSDLKAEAALTPITRNHIS